MVPINFTHGNKSFMVSANVGPSCTEAEGGAGDEKERRTIQNNTTTSICPLDSHP